MVGTHSIVDFKLSLTKRVQWRGAQLEVVQADYLVRSYVRSLAAGAQVVMWYDFRNDTVPDPSESSFGIIRRDFSPKPANDAFSTLAHVLAGSRFLGQVRGGGDRQDDVYEYRFGSGSQIVAVLWRSQATDGPRTVQLAGIMASIGRLVGPELSPFSDGAARIVTPVAGRLAFALGERPIFVVIDSEDPPQPLPLIPWVHECQAASFVRNRLPGSRSHLFQFPRFPVARESALTRFHKRLGPVLIVNVVRPGRDTDAMCCAQHIGVSAGFGRDEFVVRELEQLAVRDAEVNRIHEAAINWPRFPDAALVQPLRDLRVHRPQYGERQVGSVWAQVG